MLCPGSLGEGPTAETRILALDFTQGPLATAATPPQCQGLGAPSPLPQRFPPHAVDPAPLRTPCLGWEGCTQAAQSRPLLAEVVPAWEIFSPPHTQALSQVPKRPGHRTVEMFPGTHLHGRVLRGENADGAATIPGLVREGGPYLP